MRGEGINKLLKDNKGSTNLIIVCTCLIVIILSSIVSDIGYGQLQFIMLKENAKMIVKQGAKELIKDRKSAEGYVKAHALQEVNDLNQLDINISDTGREITIHLGKPYKYSIMKIIGIEKRQFKTVKTAKISNISSYSGIRPFAISRQKLEYGKKCLLSNAKNNVYGSIQFIDLNLGSSSFEQSIANGYKGKVSLGNTFTSYPVDAAKEYNWIERLLMKSAKANNSYANNENYYPRVLIIPVVDKISQTVNKPMAIVGFASFNLESCSSQNGGTVLCGRFVKSIVNGSESDGVEDFGLYGISIKDGE